MLRCLLPPLRPRLAPQKEPPPEEQRAWDQLLQTLPPEAYTRPMRDFGEDPGSPAWLGTPSRSLIDTMVATLEAHLRRGAELVLPEEVIVEFLAAHKA